MTAPVSAEVIEKAATALDEAGLWPSPDEHVYEFAERAAAAMLAAVRADLVAEALAPIRAELTRSFAQSAVSDDPHKAHREAVDYVRESILAVLPAAVQAAEEHRMVPGSHERMNGPECVCGKWSWPCPLAAEEVGGDGE